MLSSWSLPSASFSFEISSCALLSARIDVLPKRYITIIYIKRNPALSAGFVCCFAVLTAWKWLLLHGAGFGEPAVVFRCTTDPASESKPRRCRDAADDHAPFWCRDACHSSFEPWDLLQKWLGLSQMSLVFFERRRDRTSWSLRTMWFFAARSLPAFFPPLYCWPLF